MLGPVFALFILIVGVAAVATAARFAIQPRERTLAILRPLTASTAFATVSAMMGGIALSLKNAADGALSADALQLLVAGFAESAVPGVIGFAFLAVAWLLTAVGFRRQT